MKLQFFKSIINKDIVRKQVENIFTSSNRFSNKTNLFQFRSYTKESRSGNFKNNRSRISATFGIGTVLLGVVGIQLWKKPDYKSNNEDAESRQKSKLTLQDAIDNAREMVLKIKDETGSPGMIVAVSIDGNEVWSEGFGYCDVENRTPCCKDTIMRIASISKPITMAVVGKLWENGMLDLNKPVRHYLPEFPQKEYDGKKVDITTRQLVSHLAGIRHYSKRYQQEGKNKDPKSLKEPENEYELKEYYITKKFKTVGESLKLFQDDPLVHKPGSKFLYTSHGWTLVSAVVESVSKKPFDKIMKEIFKEFGMESTYLDENEPIIYNRSRNYIKNKKGRLVNAPYVDNSYKWAGGGFLSSVGDLLKFAHIMLYSYQSASKEDKTGYLTSQTLKSLWTPVDNTEISWDKDGSYGMGWGVVPEKFEYGCCRQQRYYVSHTGSAVGTSSVLLILPSKDSDDKIVDKAPRGICVSLITNLISVGLNKTALDIAKTFEDVNEK